MEETEDMFMRTQTTDPITGNDLNDLENAPYVIEGRGEDALKIYFESEESRQTYLDVELETLDGHSVQVFNGTTGKGMEM